MPVPQAAHYSSLKQKRRTPDGLVHDVFHIQDVRYEPDEFFIVRCDQHVADKSVIRLCLCGACSTCQAYGVLPFIRVDDSTNVTCILCLT